MRVGDWVEFKNCQRFETKFNYLKYIERQKTRCTVEVESIIRKKLKSTTKFYFMKRKLASCSGPVEPKKSSQMDFKQLANQDVTTKRNNKTRLRNVRQQQQTWSWDPDSFCSDSSSSPNSQHTHGPSDHPHLKAQKSSCALFLADREDVQGLDLRQKCSSPSLTGKISLAPGSEAVDTLKSLGLNNMSEVKRHQYNNSPLDGSVSDESVVSGPSSFPISHNSLRCGDCERLFFSVRRQGASKITKRNHDPSSLSCDQWLLKKTWRPQRRQQVRGKLWVHLRRIRERTTAHLDSGKESTTRPVCSRAHVFLNRNLRHCREMSDITVVLSKSKLKPWHHRRPRTTHKWPPLGAKPRRQIKRKSSEKDSTQYFSYIDLTEIQEDDKLPAENKPQLKDLQQHENLCNKQSVRDMRFPDKQLNSRGPEGTRRVLKFESSICFAPVESQKSRQSLAQKSGKLQTCTNLEDLTKKRRSPSGFNHSVVDDGTDVFKTPSELCDVEDRIIRKSRPSSTHGTQRDSFRSMLTAMKKTRNQIIKESQS